MRSFNALIALILRSPLHRLFSRSVMLITVTGRKSGRRYTTPVNYVRDGDVVTVISRRGRRWWRNLRGGSPVALHLRGRKLEGMGDITATEEKAVAEALLGFYQRLAPQRADREKVASLAPDCVVIRVRLAR